MNQSANQNEVETLTQGYLEGSLTPSESPRLLALLKEDPARVKLILANLQTDALIKEVVDQSDWVVRTSTAAAPSADEILPANLIEEIDFSALSASVETLAQPRRSTRRPLVRWPLALAASVAFFVGLSVWLFPVTDNAPRLAVAPGTPATLERGGQATTVSDAVALAAGDVLRTGDATGSNAITLHYGRERTQISLFGGSELKVLNWGKGKRLELREGKLEASIARQRPFQPMRVSTPQAEARVLGTRFALTVTTNSTRVDVTEGRVRLTRNSDDASVKVGAGYYAIAATNVVLSSLPQTGVILREYWTNIPGSNDENETLLTTNTNFPNRPNGREFLTRLEVSPNWGDNFGDRICGYLHPPTTGAYSFFISGDAGSQLRLSRNDDPENKMPIAWAEETDSGEWTKSPSQRSVPLTLTAGKRYYIEVLRHCGTGPDHLAVAWQPPGGRIEVIPGEFLSPLKPKK